MRPAYGLTLLASAWGYQAIVVAFGRTCVAPRSHALICGATNMEYISAILGHVVPIISEASKSQFGLMSLIALIALAIVLLFLYLAARTRPVLSFVLALVAILLMF